MDAYIISYFGKSSATRLARVAYHFQQLNIFLANPLIETIHVLSMDYKHNLIGIKSDSLYMRSPRVVYHDHELVPPSVARNVLMRMFNATNKPWALFADNDCVIDHRLHGGDIVNIIQNNTHWLEDCDVLLPTSPRHQPWGQYQIDHAELLTTHVPIEQRSYFKSSIFFLRNRTHYGHEPVLFDESLNELEDWAYVPELLLAGGSLWKLPSVLMNEFGQHTSTLFEATTVEKQTEMRLANWNKIKSDKYLQYKNHGAQRNKLGNITWVNMTHNNLDKWRGLPLTGVDNALTEHYYHKFNVHTNFADLFEVIA
jgi:hypothetical protein